MVLLLVRPEAPLLYPDMAVWSVKGEKYVKAPQATPPHIVLSSFQSHRVGQDVLGPRAQSLSLLERLLEGEIPGLRLQCGGKALASSL